MAKLNDVEVTGTKYERACQVVINNPLDGVPSILFQREQVLTIEGEVIKKSLGNIEKMMIPENMKNSFPLLDPATDNDTKKTATYGDVYVMVYSLFRALAAAETNA